LHNSSLILSFRLLCPRRAPGCALAALLLAIAPRLCAQMHSGTGIPGFAETMNVELKPPQDSSSVQFIASTAPANILWPGEQAEFTFQVVNNSKQELKQAGKVELIAHGTKGRPNDIW